MVVVSPPPLPLDTTCFQVLPSADTSTLYSFGSLCSGGGASLPKPLLKVCDLNCISETFTGLGNSTWNHMPAFCVVPVVHPSKVNAPCGEAVLPLRIAPVLLAVAFQADDGPSTLGTDDHSSSNV